MAWFGAEEEKGGVGEVVWRDAEDVEGGDGGCGGRGREGGMWRMEDGGIRDSG